MLRVFTAPSVEDKSANSGQPARHSGQLASRCSESSIASPERARQYFGRFQSCFPIGAAPDRAIHRAYGLPEMNRTPEWGQDAERRSAELLREQGLQLEP